MMRKSKKFSKNVRSHETSKKSAQLAAKKKKSFVRMHQKFKKTIDKKMKMV